MERSEGETKREGQQVNRLMDDERCGIVLSRDQVSMERKND